MEIIGVIMCICIAHHAETSIKSFLPNYMTIRNRTLVWFMYRLLNIIWDICIWYLSIPTYWVSILVWIVLHLITKYMREKFCEYWNKNYF